MTFDDVNRAKLLVFLVGFALLFAVETVFTSRQLHSKRGKRFLFHSFLAVVNTAMLRTVALTPLYLLILYCEERGIGISRIFGLTGIWEIAATVVVLDFFDYVWHRLNHTVRLLWRFHAMHHSDNDVDVTTSLRFHPGELLMSAVMKAIWILIWGPSLWGFAVFEIGISLASQFHHSNIDLPDLIERVLRKIIVTPRFHATHHTVNKATSDNNFSTIFIWWDKLCGSYVCPDGVPLDNLGIPEVRDKFLSPQAQLTLPLRLYHN
ncbi:MAG: sterol desaturase family protein [Candidatus Dadabacteria bacterium]|nr:MAG: sterol desaturase family protein [Candidatus Dadabacteria bacterium]